MDYQLYNQTQRKVLTNHLRIATNFKSKFQGLIGRPKDQAIYFQTRLGIHSLGMQFPLTVIICDDSLTVKRVVNLHPWGVLFWNPSWQHVFELPYRQYDINLGDQLKISYE